MKALMRLVLLLGLFMLVAGCGGSSGSGGGDDGDDDGSPGEGLDMPGQLSVVLAGDDDDDGDGGNGGIGRSGVMKVDPSNFPADADYFTDEASIWVHDPSTEPMDQVNMILCHIQDTRARELVNEDPYLALNDPEKCERGSNTSGAADGAEGGGVVFDEFTVVSVHETADSDHQVQLWIEPGETFDGVEERILADIRISEGVSDDRPFGHFEMAFRSETADGQPMMYGRLATVDRDDGGAQFEFRMAADDGVPMEMDQWANVLMDDGSGDTGSARTGLNESDGQGFQRDSEFAVAFNEGLLLREDSTSGNQSCRSRDQFRTSIWRYNLYHMEDGEFQGNTVSAGDRVRSMSGFAFRYATEGGETRRGHIGYRGLWLDVPDSVDGRTVTRGHGESERQYTIEVVGGRLDRKTREAMGLDELQGDIFYWWGNDEQYRATVNQDNDFLLTHTVDWTDSGPVYTELATPELITPEQDGDELWFWHDALGGTVIYRHDSNVAPMDRQLLFFDEESIFAGGSDPLFVDSDPVTLWCRWDCLRGGLTQADLDGGTEEDWFYDYADPGGGPWEYQLDADNLVLLDVNAAASPVTLRGLSVDPGSWLSDGIAMTMVTDEHMGEDNYFLAPTSYGWETGTRRHAWRFRAVDTDSGNVVDFAPPLRFLYQHSVGNDRNGDPAYDGRQVMLQYEGAGELHGFPWSQDEETGRWVSPINLADGVVLSDGADEFVVRGMEMDQTMLAADGQCGPLLGELPDDGTLPQPDMPVAGDVSFDWSDRPTVDDEPRVIDGEIQD